MLLNGYSINFVNCFLVYDSCSIPHTKTKLYQAKWAKFTAWCSSRKINPREASIPQLADFFIHLRDVHHLKLSSIRGYSSAMSGVLAARGKDISSSGELQDVFHSFGNDCTPMDRTLS